MAVLVTGGTGYIGTHTCVELLNEGYDVIAVDNLSNSKPETVNRVSTITGKSLKVYYSDILDERKLDEIFTENQIEAVFHFAGLKAVGESALIPLRYYQNNIVGTVKLCEVMRKHGVKKLVFSSSATVYGTSEKIPFHEEMPLKAASPYGWTKLMIEQMLKDLADSDPRWSIAILRYFNPIGAHESGLIGEEPTGIPNNLMPYILQVAIGKIRHLNIYGNDYPTKDGTGIRDYIHVVDLANGHLKALEKLNHSKGVQVYNLGTGNGYSVLEIVEAFEKASNQSIPYRFVERRQGDIAVCFANTDKAKHELHWQAKRGIQTMCEDSWRWQINNPYGYEKTLKSAIGNSE